MNRIATLEIIENLAEGQTDEIPIKIFCPGGVVAGISEDSEENTKLVDRLTNHIPPYELAKRKNVIINYLVKLGFRLISVASTPILFNLRGKVTRVRTEVYVELPASYTTDLE